MNPPAVSPVPPLIEPDTPLVRPDAHLTPPDVHLVPPNAPIFPPDAPLPRRETAKMAQNATKWRFLTLLPFEMVKKLPLKA